MSRTNRAANGPPWRGRLYDILFESDDRVATAFDVLLIMAILASVLVVMLDSVESIYEEHATLLYALEWVFTGLFTVEYAARMASVQSKRRYAFSFFGIIDFLAILPTYLSVLLPGTRFLAIIRVLRVLRVFRVLKLVRYLGEARTLGRALAASRYRIVVFLISVLTLVVILGSFMYLIEGPQAGFTSIPVSVYWAVVTLTTVGFGDITPMTPEGQMLAALIMLMGYGLIAIPTGIVSVELAQAAHRARNANGQTMVRDRVCSDCHSGGHDQDAQFCKACGGTVVEVTGE
jgi:voltage-gated potassium channel